MSFVKWNCCDSAIGMTELLVRATLAYLLKSECSQKLDDFLRPEDGYVSHDQRTTICCVPTNSASRAGLSSSKSISTTS